MVHVSRAEPSCGRKDVDVVLFEADLAACADMVALVRVHVEHVGVGPGTNAVVGEIDDPPLGRDTLGGEGQSSACVVDCDSFRFH